ncbi:MAG: YitT family protein [Halopseudomonas sp.]
MNCPKWVIDALYILIGCLCVALSIAVFLMPHQIAAGGPPGLAVLANHLFNISPGLMILGVNASLILLGWHSLGMKFLIRTLVAVVLIALMTDGLIFWLKDLTLSHDRFLSALYAGVFLGAGVGLLFKGGGSSGGWAILARLIADRTNITVGQSAAMLDAGIVVLSALVFRDLEAALLGGITVFIAGRVIDGVLTVQPSVLLVNITSRHANELRAVIDAQFGIQGTVIQCDAADSPGEKDLLHLSLDRRHLKTLKTMIEAQAPDAYVTIADAVGVMGRR